MRITARCAGNAEIVLKKAKTVLEMILKLIAEEEFREDVWEKTLPTWFVERCPRSPSNYELKRKLEHSIEERIQMEEKEGWPLRAFIYWFTPQERVWSWWDDVVVDPSSIVILIEVKDWPFPWGALRWLLKYCGATDVDGGE